MQYLTNKRILLVAPRFFGYETEIINELHNYGAEVDWLPDRPFDTPLASGITTLNPGILEPFVDNLYRRMIERFNAICYDYVFVINGQTLSTNILKLLKQQFPSAYFILYLWDSLANRPNIRKALRFYQRISTFDPTDAKAYGLCLRPLFYTRDFSNKINASTAFDYSISFVGTAHADRYLVASRIADRLTPSFSSFWHLYLKAPWVYYYYKATNRSFRHARYNDFKYKPLPKLRLKSVFRDSLAILDIEHPYQTGLTMRTFEALGAGKKLVTTNKDIRNYDFFNSDNICVIDRQDPIIPEKFLLTSIVDVSTPILHYYSIEGWLGSLLSNNSCTIEPRHANIAAG